MHNTSGYTVAHHNYGCFVLKALMQCQIYFANANYCSKLGCKINIKEALLFYYLCAKLKKSGINQCEYTY